MEHENSSATDVTLASADDLAKLASDRYERRIDLESESTHARVVALVGTDRRVLELGPATGHMTRELKERGCTVVGIEIDAEMAQAAAPLCERMIVGDIDELDLEGELGSDRFDVIVAADVLEHLRDPLAALRRLKPFLAPGGFFVISLPNVAHGSVRIALLQGHFDYQDIGLLDTTHLRFFTRASIGRLLDDADLAVAEMFHQELNLDASEVPYDPARVPADVLAAMARDPDARTYQFVFKAVALDTPGMRDLQRRLRELAHENADLRERATEAQTATSGREDQLRAALIAAHDWLLRRDDHIRLLQDELSSLKDRLEIAQRVAADAEEAETRARVRLERILSSPPGRAYTSLLSSPLLRRVQAARTARYQSAVRAASPGSDAPPG